MEIKNRTFIVTGGASGLGAATTEALLERGAYVIAADPRGPASEGAVFVETCVTNPDQVAHAIFVASQQPGPLSGIVNCAGIGIATKVLGRDGPPPLDEFLRVLTIGTASAAAFDGQIGQGGYEFAALAAHIVENQMINGEVIRLDGALRMAAR
ncbi:SDR family NAD(P)-dependent oxidoreductase [Arthrobacter cryoconiti]|uniref:SDR family NAD(P)-dependent oxidoreductase n=1 Tax=Arthrobacter cryoconiti TaxID=748907 RepID=A0ABV8QWM1_9MICC|nr:SDR family NAD(P)-dependent oxidoreductase [Arthrobacter cryoconiti]MCC9069692.1 SDR family NAD(P)-dependent oxidoreductase [Arthrobacter cryoconiti]